MQGIPVFFLCSLGFTHSNRSVMNLSENDDYWRQKDHAQKRRRDRHDNTSNSSARFLAYNVQADQLHLAVKKACLFLGEKGSFEHTLRSPRLHARRNSVLKAIGNPVLEHEQFRESFLWCKKPLHANLSDVESYESDSLPKRKEADTLELERWPHVTRFRRCKAAFQCECAYWLDSPSTGLRKVGRDRSSDIRARF